MIAPTGEAKTTTSLPRTASTGRAMASSIAATIAGAIHNPGAIAANDLSDEFMLLQREAERAADQAGADDGDLTDSHDWKRDCK